jgi:uncharacterized SAM-binding protein YcdF (DUF218 family)
MQFGLLGHLTIDPAWCVEKPSSSWAGLTWGITAWLTKPNQVIPLLTILSILPWVLPRLPWKRFISLTSVILLLIYLLGSSPVMFGIGNRLLAGLTPNDSGQNADAIVILGRGGDLRQERVDVAAQLWQAQRAPLLFASGWGDATQIAEMLVDKGIPQPAVKGEPCSRTTEENALFTAALLQPQGIRRILLVTDAPHMLRSLLTFRSFGFEVIPSPNSLPASLPFKHKMVLLLREYAGLFGYGILGRFSPRDVPASTVIYTAGLKKD